ncbi:MAG: outer membrane-stress sensor serine endopeptidase DegS [Ferrimonas sp.]
MALLRYLLKPIFAGLSIAAIVIILDPELRQRLPQFTPYLSQVERNSFAAAVRRAAPAVVNVYSHRQGGGHYNQLLPQGLGSGIIMRDDGYILTNYHVIHQADQISVALQDGRIAEAQLIGIDPFTDLAVMKIHLDDLPVIPLDMNRQVQVGDAVLAIGNPYDLGQTITQGIISATGRNGLSTNVQEFIQTDAAINQGNSGGALVDADGRLVGVNTANYQQLGDAGVGLNFAIPIELAHTIMTTLIRDGRVIRGHLGIVGVAVNESIARQLRLPAPKGIFVSDLDEQGPASKAGLQAGDVLIAINDETITGNAMLMDTIAETPPGTEINVQLIRQGRYYQLPVTVSERPALR